MTCRGAWIEMNGFVMGDGGWIDVAGRPKNDHSGYVMGDGAGWVDTIGVDDVDGGWSPVGG